jgi:isopentenyldiphosphate isomerase
MYDELLDLVDVNDVVIATMPRSQVFAQGLTNFRLVSAFVKNNDGKFCFFRRARNKKVYPGAFGLVGGCVQSGESYQEALIRELQEEIGVDVQQLPHRILGHIGSERDSMKGNGPVYEVTVNAELSYNTDDFCEQLWITPQQLYERIQQGEAATHNLPILLQRFDP